MNTIPILLTTANARYTHTAFGLRRLWSNLGALRDQARIVEFTLQDDALDMVEQLLAFRPAVIGLGVYIWNAPLMSHVVELLRKTAPEVCIVLGGPEMADRKETDALPALADYVIDGEGEEVFDKLAARLLAGERPRGKIIRMAPARVERLASPYAAYTDENIAHRVLYVESSRGCPYGCAFCLSSRERQVRYFPLEPFLSEMDALLARGARRFKFTDRTFNVRDTHALAILRFFLERTCPGMQLHFEIMPDRLSPELLSLMAAFPKDALHLEVGVQTVNPDTQVRIGRHQRLDATWENIRRLQKDTGARLHADLVLGLPGDDWESVGAGFDRLVELGIPEIQVGILKRLPGTAIAGTLGAALTFDPQPPYEVLSTPDLTFEQLCRLKRLARYFDLYYNSGNFPTALPMLFGQGPSAFAAFAAFSDWLWDQERRTHQLPLQRLAQHLHAYLSTVVGLDASSVAKAVESDYKRLAGRRDKLALHLE